MDFFTTSLEEIKLIGIEIRTDNSAAHNDIPKLWQNFFSENIQEKILNKASGDIIALYTDYESDFTKPYTLIIGCKVNDINKIPAGMTARTIQASKYAVFNAKGKMPEEILNTWKIIWNSDVNRTYSGDFELYSVKYRSSSPELDIFVAIK